MDVHEAHRHSAAEESHTNLGEAAGTWDQGSIYGRWTTYPQVLLRSCWCPDEILLVSARPSHFQDFQTSVMDKRGISIAFLAERTTCSEQTKASTGWWGFHTARGNDTTCYSFECTWPTVAFELDVPYLPTQKRNASPRSWMIFAYLATFLWLSGCSPPCSPFAPSTCHQAAPPLLPPRPSMPVFTRSQSISPMFCDKCADT